MLLAVSGATASSAGLFRNIQNALFRNGLFRESPTTEMADPQLADEKSCFVQPAQELLPRIQPNVIILPKTSPTLRGVRHCRVFIDRLQAENDRHEKYSLPA